ncbi:hypothetical protein AGMMS49992_30090 [Clostridia bacterium]|nr:hypothetical protein AGMMS49992_30090 [Clostridia bacterium]
MVSDLRNGKAQVVVCKDGKRFTRDSVDRLLYQMRILPELGVERRWQIHRGQGDERHTHAGWRFVSDYGANALA